MSILGNNQKPPFFGLTPIFHKTTLIILPFFFSPPLLSTISAILCGTLQPRLKMASLWFPLFAGDLFQQLSANFIRVLYLIFFFS